MNARYLLFAVAGGGVKDLHIKGLPTPGAGPHEFQVMMTILLGILGALCLLFITIGGLRYVLSQGDPQGTAKAKGTIIYALVGLVVVILAQAIVSFVVGRLT